VKDADLTKYVWKILLAGVGVGVPFHRFVDLPFPCNSFRDTPNPPSLLHRVIYIPGRIQVNDSIPSASTLLHYLYAIPDDRR
jgi:hypothetical protein